MNTQPLPPEIDYEKETVGILNACLDSMTITWTNGGKQVQTSVGKSKGAVSWLRSYTQRAQSAEREKVLHEVGRLVENEKNDVTHSKVSSLKRIDSKIASLRTGKEGGA